ncbi:MAG: hypothetical protein BMS9Abin04_026 [Planctomycetia bacterium]|nr:MAG: hypothetical protein BMS9Abin04_026 [Planctomycetia bacterium]
MDYEVQRCTRRCAKTQRLLKPGETLWTALVVEGGDVVRYDYSEEAWAGPPEDTVGWWKSQLPDSSSRQEHLAPSDVMLQLFDQWADDPTRQDLRYVLTLLLVRRRIVRLEQTAQNAAGEESLVVYCPRREATYEVPVLSIPEPRIDQIQEELAELLYSGQTQ